MKYWIIVTSRDHALHGKEEGIVQANHGKEGPLKRMSAGDKVLIYASKMVYGDPEPCQRFVTLAELTKDAIFQATVSPDFKPFRRKAHYSKVEEAEIKPLLEHLEFVTNKKSWGYSFRFGFFEINEHDFELISKEMTA